MLQQGTETKLQQNQQWTWYNVHEYSTSYSNKKKKRFKHQYL